MTCSSTGLTLLTERLGTPIGTMLLLTDEQHRVRVLDWDDQAARVTRLLRLHYGDDGATLVDSASRSSALQSLEAYFDGDVRIIDTVPVETGGTPFQRSVWTALRRIPAGRTVSYGELAAAIGRPRAVRAVGMANGSNPVSIIVPCHRVIGSDASLTGYGGGLARKQWLLDHEGATAAHPATRENRRR
jgi:methylated-DNA-[protein]-cysteine S-methyltransferase